MDIGQYDTVKGSTEGAEMDVYAPDGTLTDIKIRLLGADSPVYQEAKRRQTDKRMTEMSRRTTRTFSLSDVEDSADELLAVCTLGWTDTLLVDKQLYPHSKKNALALYKRFPWIREQVEVFIGNRANFLQTPSSQ